MKIAVAYDNGMVFQHFGHSRCFKIYEAENAEITGISTISPEGEGHGALAGFLKEQRVDILICGGIGAGAKNALSDAGIDIYAGISGSADRAVIALLAGKLEHNSEVNCNHHHDHHDCSHH